MLSKGSFSEWFSELQRESFRKKVRDSALFAWNGKGLPAVGAKVRVNCDTKDGSYEPAVVAANVISKKHGLVTFFVYLERDCWNWGSVESQESILPLEQELKTA